MQSLAPFLEPIETNLADLLLDPNNPRFVGAEWIYVPDDESASSEVQADARRRLTLHHEVDKLKQSIEANGFLPIDRVVVREIEGGKFIVLEGNRRICAAQKVNGYSDDGTELSPDVMDSLKRIPCLKYTGENEENEAAWIFQGIRHISGVQEWPAFNKAKLLVDQVEEGGQTFTEIGKKFGLSSFGAAQWMRGYYAFRQAKQETEFGSYVSEKLYPYFQELFGRSSIAFKEWLDWDENQNKFKSQANLNEFVSWFFPVERDERDSEEGVDKEPTEAEMEDAWARRRISKRDDIRQLSYLKAKGHREWMEFRSGTELDKAYSTAILREMEERAEGDEDLEVKLFKYLEETSKLLKQTPFSILSVADKKARLLAALSDISTTADKLKSH